MVISESDNLSDVVFLTVSRAATQDINIVLIHHLFNDQHPLANIPCDFSNGMIDIYPGFRVLLTQSRDKSHDIVNGQIATVSQMHNATILLSLPDGKIASVYSVTQYNDNGERVTIYPFVTVYALIICKVQGQTLDYVVLLFDVPILPPGTAYVAISRVRRCTSLSFLTRVFSQQFVPVPTTEAASQ